MSGIAADGRIPKNAHVPAKDPMHRRTRMTAAVFLLFFAALVLFLLKFGGGAGPRGDGSRKVETTASAQGLIQSEPASKPGARTSSARKSEETSAAGSTRTVPRPALEGFVVGKDGSPVANATVTLASCRRDGTIPVATATTNAAGSFRLEFDSTVANNPGALLTVEASGFAHTQIGILHIPGVSTRRLGAIAVHPPVPFTVSVVRNDGTPVGNAKVAALPVFDDVFGLRNDFTKNVRFADLNGRVEFQQFAGGRCMVFASAPGFTRAAATVEPDSVSASGVQLVLEPAPETRVCIRDPAGRPLRNLNIELIRSGMPPDFSKNVVATCTVERASTNADGFVVLDGLSPKDRIELYFAGWPVASMAGNGILEHTPEPTLGNAMIGAGGSIDWMIDSASFDYTMDIMIQKAPPGFLQDFDPADPPPPPLVYVVYDGGRRSNHPLPPGAVSMISSQQIRVTGLPQVPHSFHVVFQGNVFGWSAAIEGGHGDSRNAVARLELRDHSNPSIAYFQNPDGTPAHNVRLAERDFFRMRILGSMQSGSHHRTSVFHYEPDAMSFLTDETGAVQHVGIFYNNFLIETTDGLKYQFHPTLERAAPPDRHAESWILPKPATIRGMVLLNGRPPELPARVTALCEDSPLTVRYVPHSIFTNADGTFELTGLPPGNWDLYVKTGVHGQTFRMADYESPAMWRHPDGKAANLGAGEERHTYVNAR